MSKLAFTIERARALADFYRTRDMAAQRAATMEKLAIRAGEDIIDIGSGPGFLSSELAAATGPKGRVLGIDVSEDLVSFCRSGETQDWLTFEVADATALPAHADSFDVAVCTQVLEYVPDVMRVLTEMFRVLKPRGRALVVATDWDTVAWHSDNPERMAKIMQAWEAHCAHPRLPRKLAKLLRTAGFQTEGIALYPLVNGAYDSQSYSYGISKLIRDYVVDGGHMSKADGDAWLAELADLDAAGAYYFTSGRMFFSASKGG